MPWVRTDDQHREHPKIAAAGPLAAHLDQIAWEYCSANLTDGFVPVAIVRTLVDWSGVKWQGRAVDPLALADLLCSEDVDRWEHAPGGYRVHDYLAYNPSRAKVLAERDATARRVAEHRAQKRASNGVTRPIQMGKYEESTRPPVPGPVPVPHEASTQTEDLHKQQTAGAGAAAVEQARVFAVPKPGLPPGSPQVALIGAFASAAGYAEPTTKTSRAKWIDGAQELLHATPPVTADEIPGLVERYREENTVPVTLPGIAGQLPQLRSPHVASRPQNGRHESARAQLDRVFGGTT